MSLSQTTISRSHQDETFQGMVETLLGLLRQECHQTLRVVRWLRARAEAMAKSDILLLERCGVVAREILHDHAIVACERVAALTEIGLTLGHARPSRLRLAELIHYVSPELRDELLDVREDLRDLADELESLYASTASLERHKMGQVTVFTEPGWLPANDDDAHAGRDGGESGGRGVEPADESGSLRFPDVL